MLSNAHFYYQLLRKYVTIFGNMFNDIVLVRYDQDRNEIERVKVPIIYGPKDKAFQRNQADPDLNNPIQVPLPRMSFEISALTYDVSRKQIATLRAAAANNATRVNSNYMGVPYDINFDLNIYAKNLDEANQILEQIIPYFNPDYTVSINPVPDVGFIKDIAIILNAVNPQVDYTGSFEQPRVIEYNLNFTLKGYFFGPISYPKIIRKVITNIFNDPTLVAGYIVRINTADGNHGKFKSDDTVYVGDNFNTASAYGIVYSWGANSGKLILSGTQGTFKINNTIKAVSTNASYRLASFDASPLKLAEITIEPDPLTANADDDFGYTTTITEWPDTEAS